MVPDAPTPAPVGTGNPAGRLPAISVTFPFCGSIWTIRLAPTSATIRLPSPASAMRRTASAQYWYFIPTILAIAGLPHAGGAGGIRYPRRAAAVVHHGVETIALFLEARHQRSFERAAARQLDAHRIDETPVDQNFVVDVGAGRHPGRSDEADHLTLPHPLAGLHALGVGRHVAVGGLVAVVVLQADVFAVTAFPADLFDDAVAGGENRRAIGRSPVDAGVHLDITEDGMAASAKARAHDGVVDRLAHQELLRALAGLVVEIDHGIIGSLELIVFLGLAADGKRREQHFGFLGYGGVFVVAGEE